MLKKVIALILCIAAVCSLIACGNIETPSNLEGISADGYNTVETTAKKPPFIFGTATGEVPPNGGNGSGNGNNFGSNQAVSFSYKTFEENFESIDTVVKAKIKKVSLFGSRYTKFTFDVTEVLRGVAADTIDVYASSLQGTFFASGRGNVYFYENGITLNEGDEYLLMLTMGSDVYCKVNPRYHFQLGMIINLDNIPESEMYNESLALHAKGIDINTCTKDEIITYVIELVGDNKPKILSSAQTLEEITNEAYDLLHIKVKSLSSDAQSPLSDDAMKATDIMYCEVIESLKGKKDEYDNEIEIIFFDGTVKPGEEYIVAIDAFEKEAYIRFLTPNSLRPVSEKDEIKGYINK